MISTIAIIFASLFAQDTPATSAPAVTKAATPQTPPTVIVAIGAPGTEEFGKSFTQWGNLWEAAGKLGQANVVRLEGQGGTKTDRDLMKATIEASPITSPLWIVLLGHGTFDDRSAKFNLRGPDVAGKDLNEWLGKDRKVAIVNCASASAPFINRLSGKNRVVVTATKSGLEHNYARFGEYLAKVIADASIDLDKDGQTSLLEAWLVAARRTQDFYKENGRLATEHALIDDNGDERGTRFDAFVGLRPVARSKGGALDGFRAHQWHLVRGKLERSMPARLVAERDDLEMAVIRLRENRSDYREEDYYAELEQLLVPLAILYEQAEQSAAKKTK